MKHKSLTASMVLLAVGLAISVWGDSTTLSISNGSVTVTGNSPSTLNFPITRSGDTSYDAFLQYQTVDGTAVAGVDYTAAMGSIVIPAGMTSATIPVTVSGSSSNPPDKMFQMLLLGGGGAGMGFAPSFATERPFEVGIEPTSVTVADVNGDGLPDLIVANEFDSTVSVLINATAPGAATPSFAIQQTFAVGAGPVSVSTADITGDGKLDLIVANGGDNTVSVLLNTTAAGATTASFATQQTFATGTSPRWVTVADINHDGMPDLIVANSGDNTVSVLLNTTAPGATTASFATQQTFAVGNFPQSVTAADLNGVGLPDLIVANSVDNTVSVLINVTSPGDAFATFATQQTFATGNDPVSVTAADVNGDGLPDLIVSNEGDNTVSVLLNTQAVGTLTASFATQQTFAAGHGPDSVTVADVNDDGRPDLIVSNEGDSAVSVLLDTTAPGATTPSFTAQQSFATRNTPQSVAVADINGDGKPDLIVTNSDSTVSVLLNAMSAPTTAFDGNSFANQRIFRTGSQPLSVTAADVNNDGKPDLIVTNKHDNTVLVLVNTTAPGATAPSFTPFPSNTFSTGSGPVSVTTADVNGDGMPDLIVANATAQTVSVLKNTTPPFSIGFAEFAPAQTFAVGDSPSSVTAADLNGDGKPDLIVANFLSNTVSVLLNTTAPGFINPPSFAAQQTFAAGSGPISVTTADINGDGRPDLIVANQDGVSVLLNTTTPGATTASFDFAQSLAVFQASSVTVADVNGDGLPDLIVTNGSNTVSVLLNTTARGSGTVSFAPPQSFSVGSGAASVTAADLNGDGKPDLIVANSGDNTVSVLLNTTAPGATGPSFATQQTFQVGNTPISVTAADLNGDGKPDLIVANETDNTVSVRLNTLYAATASGSPATGTIHYAIPTATATNTATATETATATPTATPTTSVSVPATLAMGTSAVGDTITKDLIVNNTGTHRLFIGSVSSSNPAEFTADASNCPAGGLGLGSQCAIAISFTPSALGARGATLSINDNTATSPKHVALSGTGVADMTVTPSSFGFGEVKIGAKVTKTITVTNKQNIAVTLTLPPGFSGMNAGDFSRTGGTCTSTLGAKTSCTLIVTYAPTQLGTESATMTVADSPDTLGPYMVSFTTAENIPATVVPATTLAFGTTTVAHPNKTKTVTVTNLSAFSLAVSEGSPTGSNAADFAVTGGGTCGGTVSANSTCTIAITFTPTAGPSAESASIVVTIGSDPNSPHNVALTGTGP